MQSKEILVEMAKIRNEYVDEKNEIISKEYAKITGADYMLFKLEQLIKNNKGEASIEEDDKNAKTNTL